MKYKVRLTATRSYASYTHNFREEYYFHYSDRMQVKSLNKSVEVYASIKDAETLQRLNPQHEVEIWSTYDERYISLWFFRKYETEMFTGGLRNVKIGDAIRELRSLPYEPTHPIVDQAPAFIYQPSERFKQKLHERREDKWFGKGWRQAVTEPLTVSKLKEYLTNIFVRRNNKERRQIKIGIYCPHVGHWITVGPSSWPCPECYHERIGKHLYEQAQNYLKADKYYGKHT